MPVPPGILDRYWTWEVGALARTLRDTNLGTREARLRLKARPKPYWRLIEPGLHLGYRRLAGRSGPWCKRRGLGAQRYKVEGLGAVADDYATADAVTVLTFQQAQRAVLASKPASEVSALTVAGVIEFYLEYLAAHGKATLDDSTKRANALIVPTLGDVAVDALTTEQIRAWHAGLARSPGRHTQRADAAEMQRRRRCTANRTLMILRAALNLAYREGHVSSDAAWKRAKPFKNVDAAKVRHLTVVEAQRLLNSCEPDFRKLVQAALITGMRFGELRALRVTDFNGDSGSVLVRQSKSGKSRHVFLNTEGLTFFKQWCAGRRGSEPLLTRNGAPWGENDQTRLMLLACKRAAIDPPVGFHALRHTYASLAIMAGAPLLVVAKMLGHRDGRMVELHYGHLAQSYLADTIRSTAPTFGIAPASADVVVPLARR